MKNTYTLFLGLLITLCLSACRTTRIETPAPRPLAPKPALTQAKKSLAPKKLSPQEIPPVLGGLVQSDNWVIYKDKQQEEFVGHVSYDNEAYVFRADYALSDRARHTFTARGHVFWRQNNPDGSFYQAQADRGAYNYQTQKGELFGTPKKPVQLVYRNEKGQLVTAFAQIIYFNLQEKIYILEKKVRMEREDAQGTQIITAQKITLKQTQEYALAEGNATITDGKRTLVADTLEYDRKNNLTHAYGARPLTFGTTEQGDYAVIADEIKSDAQGQQIRLDGQVQGWFVSPQINDSKLNKKF